jgi:hypothetical protein
MSLDLIIILPLLGILLGVSIAQGYWDRFTLNLPWIRAVGQPWIM